jgi:hypothetical protein
MKLSRGLLGVVAFDCSPDLLCVPRRRGDPGAEVARSLGHLCHLVGGVGTALAAFIGVAYFREPLTLFKLASLALVILRVVGLSLAARQTN